MNIDQNMPQYKQKIICLGLATLLITGCADSHHNLVKDTLIGAGGGAVVGAIVPGLGIGNGAAVGAVGGAVYGALKDSKGHTIHTDERGNKYWIDTDGKRHYN